MNNKPKYTLVKNTIYALNGLKDMFKTEISFKLELLATVFLLPVLFILDLELIYKLIMFISLMGVLVAETINSAIERVVDLVTLEQHPMAGRAKDVGSTIVFLNIGIFVAVWGSVLFLR